MQSIIFIILIKCREFHFCVISNRRVLLFLIILIDIGKLHLLKQRRLGHFWSILNFLVAFRHLRNFLLRVLNSWLVLFCDLFRRLGWILISLLHAHSFLLRVDVLNSVCIFWLLRITIVVKIWLLYGINGSILYRITA